MKVGQHEYKFYVDGKWKIAPGDPLVMDPEVRVMGHIWYSHVQSWQLQQLILTFVT